MGYLILLVGVVLVVGAEAAAAAPPPTKAGPYVAYSQTAYGREDRTHGPSPKDLISKGTTTSGRVLYPMTIGTHLLIPGLEAKEESRQYLSKDSDLIPLLAQHARTITPSLTGVAEAAYPGASVFMRYAQYQAMQSPEPADPMREVLAGLLWECGDKGQGASPPKVVAAVRHRRFPHGNRWLPVFGVEKWFDEAGVGIDVRYPSHGLVKFYADEEALVTVGVETEGIEMPMRLGEEPVWAEGYHGRAVVALSHPLWKAIHGEVKGGSDRQVITVYDRFGETVETIKVMPAPYFSLALRTLF